MAPRKKLYCSFCGQPQDCARSLIGGAGGVYICDRCVADAVINLGASGIEPFASMSAKIIPFATQKHDTGE